MQYPQIHKPTVKFGRVYVDAQGVVAEIEGGTVVLASFDRFPILEAMAKSGDLEKFEVTPDRLYISWPNHGLRLSYDDVMESVEGTNIWDDRPLEAKLCDESLALDKEGRTEDAIATAKTAYLISKEEGDRCAAGRNAGNLGMFYANLGDRKSAEEFLMIALRCSNEEPYDELRANAIANLGVLHVEDREYEAGLAKLAEALLIQEKIRNFAGQSITHGEMGIAYLEMGKLDRALTSTQTALALAERANNDSLIQTWSARLSVLSNLSPKAKIIIVPSGRDSIVSSRPPRQLVERSRWGLWKFAKLIKQAFFH